MITPELYIETNSFGVKRLYYRVQRKDRKGNIFRTDYGDTGIGVSHAGSAAIVDFRTKDLDLMMPEYLFYIIVLHEGGLLLYKFLEWFKYGHETTVVMKIRGATNYETNHPWIRLMNQEVVSV